MKIDLKKLVFDTYGRVPTSLDEIGMCVVANLERRYQKGESWRAAEEKGKVLVYGLSWNVKYSECVSNTHSAPINGEENWGGRKENVPRGYPGWTGRVWVRYGKAPKSFGSAPFAKTMTHTGTGGSGSYDGPWSTVSSQVYRLWVDHRQKAPEIHAYSWDYRFYESDWTPDSGVDAMMYKLSGTDLKKDGIHTFLWQHPDAIAMDQEIDAMYQKLVKGTK